MARSYSREKNENIRICAKIRDDKNSKPIAKVQAVRAINKLLPSEGIADNPEFKMNLRVLKRLRLDTTIEDTIRIMAINTINTMLGSVGDPTEDETTEEDIMKKIRGTKK